MGELQKNSTSKGILATLIGDFLSKSFTFLVNIFLLKISTPHDFGLFSIYITFLGLGSQFVDFGINQGIVKYYSYYVNIDKFKAVGFISFGLKIKILLGIIFSISFYFLSYPTAHFVYNQDELLFPLSIAAIGVLGGTLLDFLQSSLQSEQKYSKLALVKILEGCLKLGGLLVLVVFTIFSINYIFWLYSIIPIIVFFIGSNFKDHWVTKYSSKEYFSELYSFSKWIFISSLLTMIITRLDVLMLSFLEKGSFERLGIYSAGLKLGLPLLVATGSVTTVFFPKAMMIKTRNEIKEYIISTLKVTIPLSLGFVIYWFMIEIMIPNYLSGYIPALPILKTLLIAYIFTLIGNPITLLMLTINKQKFASIINLIQLVSNIILNLILYQYHDILGIALGLLITHLIGGVITFFYLYQFYRSKTSL